MTKQFLILAYILAVLVISSMVRAEIRPEISHGLVHHAEIDQQSGILNVHGVLPNPCQIKPKLVIDRIDQKLNIVTFDVEAYSQADICIETLGANFDIAFDLKEIPLEPNKTYSLVFQNYTGNQRNELKYTPVQPGENFEPYKVSKHDFRGTLAPFSNPMIEGGNNAYILENGQEQIKLAPTGIDFKSFKGEVSVSGYVVETAALNDPSDSLAPSSHGELIIVPVSVSKLSH